MKDLELEKGLLNLILQQPGIIDDIVEKLDIDLFTKKMHRDIFSRMMKLYNSTGEISKVKILRYGRDKYSMQGMEQLLSSDYILPMEVEVILQELQNYMNQRKLREAFVRAYKYVEDHEVSITERNAKVQDIIFESTAGIGREESLITNPEEVAIECLEKLIERQEGITVERIRTGMGPVDWILSGGLRRKNLSVLAGGTSMGKSAFALNLVR
ncbi:MAG: DnaB-like helicase N-terminal domain-containing protein, partial [bacterium]